MSALTCNVCWRPSAKTRTPPKPRRSLWTQFRETVSVGLSSPARAVALLAAFVCYLGQCASLAFALGHVAHWFVAGPQADQPLLEWWPLMLAPGGAPRLALTGVLCVAVAVCARLIAGRLYRVATRESN